MKVLSRQRASVLLLLVAGACMLPAVLPAVLPAQRAALDKIIQRRVLPNGLEVIVVENHGVPLATVEVNVGTAR